MLGRESNRYRFSFAEILHLEVLRNKWRTLGRLVSEGSTKSNCVRIGRSQIAVMKDVRSSQRVIFAKFMIPHRGYSIPKAMYSREF